MASAPSISHVILVPGLFSPRWMMLPLRRSLGRHVPNIVIWDDAHVFKSTRAAVQSLCRSIEATSVHATGVCIVSHSFGDWIARQALQLTDAPRVVSLISLVPVLTASRAARIAYALGLRCIPEIRVMAHAERASMAVQLRGSVRRVIVWARIDPWVHRVDIAGAKHVTLAGTHNTIIMRPKLHRLLAGYVTGTGEQ